MAPTILPLPSTSGLLSNEDGCLHAYSLRETTGAASAVVRFIDGSGSGGIIALPISLAASESTRDWFGRHHWPFKTGLYYQVVSGTVEGSAVYDPGHDCGSYFRSVEEALLRVAAAAVLGEAF